MLGLAAKAPWRKGELTAPFRGPVVVLVIMRGLPGGRSYVRTV